jgi:dCTP deaminase
MCVLTRDAILAELESGRLRIEPFELDQVGPASIDLHLGAEIRVPEPHDGEPLPLSGDCTPKPPTRLHTVREFFVLEPGATVHGATRERLFLPPDLCGWLEGRSKFARVGLTVHATSGFVHPGVANHQVLELSNVSAVPLALHPGLRICQIVLERTEGSAIYRGRFASQTSP